jgi:hypothetical protein
LRLAVTTGGFARADAERGTSEVPRATLIETTAK